jgi:aspartate carbamoyltransferase catalytic subunit
VGPNLESNQQTLKGGKAMTLNHLLSTQDLPLERARYLLDAARAFFDYTHPKSSLIPSIQRAHTDQVIPLLASKTVVNLFFENSTRTRTSFEIATRRLGGSVLNFSAATSSTAKGETLVDTALNLVAMAPHCLVVRHSASGAPMTLSHRVSVPVINAGDGFHEHPTQALLDAFTLENKLGPLDGKHLLIVGDIAHSRVARSNIYLLKKLGMKITVCGPPTLLPPSPEGLGVSVCHRPEEALGEVDAVMMLRIQLERQNKMQIPSIAEYARYWGLSAKRAKLLKSNALILHPGPVNRGVEIDPSVADDPRSEILNQVSNGVVVRMAVLSQAIHPEGLQKWLLENRSPRASLSPAQKGIKS